MQEETESEPDPSTQSNLTERSVSELSAALKRTVEDTFGLVRVRGEVGRVSRPGSGHIYLDLKDDRAVLAAVIWKGNAARLKTQPEQGLEVVVTGKLTTFPGQSKYQIIIEALEPAGAGALMALLEERRTKLAAEGLFAEERKQLLPFLPKVIGVVTSPSGSVIRDILHRISDRFPLHVIVWPVRVQGETSGREVAAAIRGFNDLPENGPVPRPDVLIIARGGGSIEDLWGYNEEDVVRAAADSAIPLVSAVGHETDWTLIDLAADIRAPTPTGAAEMAVPVKADLQAKISTLDARLKNSLTRKFEQVRAGLLAADRGLGSPDEILSGPRQAFDNLAARLSNALVLAAQSKRADLRSAVSQLRPSTLIRRVDLAKDQIRQLNARSRRAFVTDTEKKSAQLKGAWRLVENLSHTSVLQRGFALVRDAAGNPAASATLFSPGDAFSVQFHDGLIDGLVKGGKPRKAIDKAKSKTADKPNQGDLF